MTIQYQYQGHAEPISQDQEAVRIDKWQGSENQPIRAGVFSAALFAVSMAFVPLVSAVETVTVDKWINEQAMPVRSQPQIQTDGFSFVELVSAVETVTVDKWHQPSSIPVGERQDIRRGYFDIDSNLLTQPEDVKLDKWFKEISQPLFEKPTPTENPFLSFVELIVPDVPVDSWYVQHHNPVLPKQDIQRYIQHYDIDTFILTQPEGVGIDKWFVPLSEPVRPIVYAVNTVHNILVDFSVPALADPITGKIRVFTLDDAVRVFEQDNRMRVFKAN